MKNRDKIKKLLFGFWGAIVVFAVLSGLYYQFIYERKPIIFYQIISEVNALDINQPLKDLQILFQGDDIQEKNLNLRIYNIKVENTSRVDILQSHFDENDNWGIKVENARIIETRLVSSNSDYMGKNLSPRREKDDIIKFNKIIFDQGNYFIIEISVLHDKNNPPILHKIGKISGIQEDNSEISMIEQREPFLASLFHGNWTVQVIRFILYFIISIVISITSLLLYIKIEESIKEKRKLVQAPRIDEPMSTSSHSSTSPGSDVEKS